MKRIIYGLIALSFFIGIGKVEARANVTATSKVYVGNTFKTSISVRDASMWEVHLSSSGPVKGCSFDDINYTSDGNNGSKNYSVTCTTTGTGTITLKLTGKTIDANGNQTGVSDSATVQVVERPKETPKSSVNTLDNLWVEGVSLDPTFNKDTTEYNVELEADVTKIKIGATKSDSKSSISGDGEKSVSEGMNSFNVVVTAENGSKRTYTIKARVKEKEPIHVTIGNDTLSVVRKREDLKKLGELYTETTVKMNEEEIPAYHGEKTGFTIIGLKDADGNIQNYIYDEAKNTYTLYEEYTFQKVSIFINYTQQLQIPKDYKKETIEIGEKKVEAYKREGKEFYLIYGMNTETGEYAWYSYDKKEGTIQRYMEEKETSSFDKYAKVLFIAVAAFFSLFLAIIGALLIKIKHLKGTN